MSDQTPLLITKSSHGNKQAYTVLKTCHFKCGTFGYKRINEIW